MSLNGGTRNGDGIGMGMVLVIRQVRTSPVVRHRNLSVAFRPVEYHAPGTVTFSVVELTCGAKAPFPAQFDDAEEPAGYEPVPVD